MDEKELSCRRKTASCIEGLIREAESEDAFVVLPVYETLKVLKDALELLKEQEPVEPRYEMIYGDKVAFCGNCDTYLGSVKYCPKCGKAVKWDAAI